jgi:hypothetical protein
MFNRLSGVAAGAVVALALAAAVAAQQPPAMPDVQKLGPQVGQPVPAFTLSDQLGRPRTIKSLMGEKGLMLVFSRSADW